MPTGRITMVTPKPSPSTMRANPAITAATWPMKRSLLATRSRALVLPTIVTCGSSVRSG